MKCVCGELELGPCPFKPITTVHRSDGPCYVIAGDEAQSPPAVRVAYLEAREEMLMQAYVAMKGERDKALAVLQKIGHKMAEFP